MSTADRQHATTSAATTIASQLREAEFVHLVTAQTGDGIAAAGLLAKALAATGSPYQTSVDGLPAAATRKTDTDLTVAIGRPAATADITIGDETACTSTLAFDIATELGTADPVLAMAGHRAAGVAPSDQLQEALSAAGIDRRPGIAVPTADPVDGLTHSMLVSGPFSGSSERAAELLAYHDTTPEPTESDWQSIATATALAVARDGTPHGAAAVENLLRPYIGGPFETIGGFGDVLNAVGRERPGQALALALGSSETDAALACWRTHATHTHETIETAETGRYNGLFVVRCADDSPVDSVARLVSQYRSPEPVTLALSKTSTAAVARPAAQVDVGNAMRRAVAAVNGDGTGTSHRARGTVPEEAEMSEFILTFKEAL